MKLIQQKIYILGNQSGTKMNESDNLLLAINGKNTGLSLQQIFIGYKQYESEIKGHSLLGEYPIETFRFKVSEDISVSFWNKNSDEEIFITKIKYPVIQAGDLELDEANFLAILEKYMPALEEPLLEEKEIPVEIKETNIEIESTFAETASVDKEEETIDHPLEEETEEETFIESEEKSSHEELIDCPSYNEMYAIAKEEGWEEYKDGNYRLLLNESSEDGQKNLVALFLIVSNETYQKIPFEVVNKDFNDLILQDESNIYTLNNACLNVAQRSSEVINK
jgi:hypothetical protein